MFQFQNYTIGFTFIKIDIRSVFQQKQIDLINQIESTFQQRNNNTYFETEIRKSEFQQKGTTNLNMIIGT